MKKHSQPIAAKTGFLIKTLQAMLPVCGLLLLLALLYCVIASFTFNIKNYPTQPEFRAMAEEVTRYLSGSRPILSSLFTEREAAHMVDVLRLFMLGKWISYAAVAFTFSVVFFAWIQRVPGLIKRLQMGMGSFFVFAFLLAAWAAMDFEGWFVVMHKIAFTNDLWLLDPRESLLIQMLPIDFFIRAVKSIVIRFLAYTAVTFSITVFVSRIAKRRAQ